MDGQPFLLINKEVDPGLLATLRSDLAPWLETNTLACDELQKRLCDDPRQRRFTLVFDREAYSPEFFAEMKPRRIAILTYHKYPGEYPGEDWPTEEFSECSVRLARGEVVTMKLAGLQSIQPAVGARGAKAVRRRPPDLHSEYQLPSRLHSVSRLHVRPLVPGKLLQVHASAL